MNCDSKIVRALRILDTARATLRTACKGQVWVIRGEDTVNLLVEGLEEICDKLGYCASMLEEVLTDVQEDGE
jgi:hypothetical protein